LEIIKTTTKQKQKELTIKILVYGDPKSGKTRLAKTLPVSDDSEVLILPVDPGTASIRDRDFQIWEPPNGNWSAEFMEYVYEQLLLPENKNIKYVVVDGLDDLGERLLSEAKDNNKDVRAAYGELRSNSLDIVQKIRDITGVRTLWITHPSYKDDGKIRAKYPGSIAEDLPGWFDIILYLREVELPDGTKKTKLITSKAFDPNLEVGDRTGLLDVVEDPDIGAIYKKIESGGLNTINMAPRRLTKNEISAIPAWVKENTTPEKFMNVRKELFGDLSINDFTIDQLNQVKEKVHGS